MSDDGNNGSDEAASKPSAVKTLLAGGVGAVVLGGAAAGVAFVSPSSGGACAPAVADHAEKEKKKKSYDEIVFVNLDPLVVSLSPDAKAQFLKVSISLETSKTNEKTAQHLQPRFRDALNTYLRAVDESDLVDPIAMTRLRAQMLRRLQVVASADIVTDVLITDFVLN